jgi:hypothetical protein
MEAPRMFGATKIVALLDHFSTLKMLRRASGIKH